MPHICPLGHIVGSTYGPSELDVGFLADAHIAAKETIIRFGGSNSHVITIIYTRGGHRGVAPKKRCGNSVMNGVPTPLLGTVFPLYGGEK